MNIEEAFTRTEINVYDMDRTTKYRCSCGEQIGFKLNDFEKHWKSWFTNLGPKDLVGAPEGQSFIDFYCPSCNLAITIQYGLSAGGQHGEFWYTIKNLVVGKNA